MSAKIATPRWTPARIVTLEPFGEPVRTKRILDMDQRELLICANEVLATGDKTGWRWLMGYRRRRFPPGPAPAPGHSPTAA